MSLSLLCLRLVPYVLLLSQQARDLEPDFQSLVEECWCQDPAGRPAFGGEGGLILRISALTAFQRQQPAPDGTRSKEPRPEPEAQPEAAIPARIRELGQDTTQFYKRLLRTRTKLERSKVMLVGPARVGKTSLLRRITGQHFRHDEVSTDGIVTCQVQVSSWTRQANDGSLREQEIRYRAVLKAEAQSALDAAESQPILPILPSTTAEDHEEVAFDISGQRLDYVVLVATVLVQCVLAAHWLYCRSRDIEPSVWGRAKVSSTFMCPAMGSTMDSLLWGLRTFLTVLLMPWDQRWGAVGTNLSDKWEFPNMHLTKRRVRAGLCVPYMIEQLASSSLPWLLGLSEYQKESEADALESDWVHSLRDESFPAAGDDKEEDDLPCTNGDQSFRLSDWWALNGFGGVAAILIFGVAVLALVKLLSRTLVWAGPKPRDTAEGQPTPDQDAVATVHRSPETEESEIDLGADFSELDQEDTDARACVVFMDFAGQHLYYLMHHIFIRPQLSVYIVAFSLEDELDASLHDDEGVLGCKTQLQSIIFWLNSIHAQAPSAPVLLVGTKADKVPLPQRERRIALIEAELEGKAFEDQLIRRPDGSAIVCVDNTADDDPGVDHVRHVLEKQAPLLDGYGDAVPLGWLRFLDIASERQRAESKDQISMDEARAWAQQCNIGDSDGQDTDKELLLMLDLHTSLGFLIHFNENVLRDVVILTPQWLMDLMSAILCREEHDARRTETRQTTMRDKHPKEWRKLSQEGILHTVLLPEVWPKQPAETHKQLLGYMLHFGLCCSVPRDDGKYIVPSLLPHQALDESPPVWESSADNMQCMFRFMYAASSDWDQKSLFLPHSLFFNLVSRLLAYDQHSASTSLFRDAGCFFGDVRFMLRIRPDLHALELTVCPEEHSEHAARSVRTRVSDSLDTLTRKFGVQYRVEVRCSCGDFVTVSKVARCRKCKRTRKDLTKPWDWNHPEPSEQGTSIPRSPAVSSTFTTCLDRPYVQKELRWAREAGTRLVVVYEKEERRKSQYFDFAKATQKYAGTEWEYILNIDAIEYMRDEDHAEVMVQKIVRKAIDVVPREKASVPLNGPGRWDFFLSHAQATGGDQTQTTFLRLHKDHSVWYDNAMSDRSEPAMEEGVKHSRCLVLFLTAAGD